MFFLPKGKERGKLKGGFEKRQVRPRQASAWALVITAFAARGAWAAAPAPTGRPVMTERKGAEPISAAPLSDGMVFFCALQVKRPLNVAIVGPILYGDFSHYILYGDCFNSCGALQKGRFFNSNSVDLSPRLL